MKAAIVSHYDQAPSYGEFPEPAIVDDEVLIDVTAAAQSSLVKAIASGKHYSSSGLLPFIPGVDGVGRLSNGQRVYFAFPNAPYGTMAQRVAVPAALSVPIPDFLDDITAAALANPGMSSWAALHERARFVRGETVLINGATGVSGQLAVQIAKHLGAKTIIATGRNPQALQNLLALGADHVISLAADDATLVTSFREAIREHHVQVILDYLWGAPAALLLRAILSHGSRAAAPRIRFVQIGNIAGSELALNAGVLRSSGLELLGSGLGSIAQTRLVQAIGEMFAASKAANLQIATTSASLTEVQAQWNAPNTDGRLVFTLS